MKYIKDAFAKYSIDKEVADELNSFLSKKIKLLDKKEFNEMQKYFNNFPIYQNLIPLLSDGNSNYWCLYSKGPLKNMVCYLNHEEPSLEPRFINVASLISMISSSPDSSVIEEFEEESFDFPTRRDSSEYSQKENVIEELYRAFQAEGIDKQVRTQTAFSVMALTSPADIERIIYPFLNDEDMYIQERAIEMLGFHRYEPAVAKLAELIKNAQQNGQDASKKALRKIKSYLYGK